MMKETMQILAERYCLDRSVAEIEDWMAGGEPSAKPTAEELAEQIAEWEGATNA